MCGSWCTFVVKWVGIRHLLDDAVRCFLFHEEMVELWSKVLGMCTSCSKLADEMLEYWSFIFHLWKLADNLTFDDQPNNILMKFTTRYMISEWIAKVKIGCICHQSTVVSMDSRCWSIDDRSSVPERGDIYIPPTPGSSWGWHWHTLLLLWCKRSFPWTWGEKKLNSSILIWSEEKERSSEVAETSIKWAGRWCNACYSTPCEACRGLLHGSGFRGRCFWRDYCSVVSGLYFRLCDRLGVEHCLNVFSCNYSRLELVIYLVYGAF